MSQINIQQSNQQDFYGTKSNQTTDRLTTNEDRNSMVSTILERGSSRDQLFLMPRQHANYTEYLEMKKMEAKRMHKLAVYSKNNRRELWKIADDIPKHFATYQKMKHNQRKMKKEEQISQSNFYTMDKFFHSGKPKIKEHHDVMNYSFKYQFDRVKQRLHYRYMQRYGSHYTLQADQEMLSQQDNRTGGGPVLSDYLSDNAGHQFQMSGICSPMNLWSERQGNSNSNNIQVHERDENSPEHQEGNQSIREANRMYANQAFNYDDVRVLPKSQNIKTRKMAYRLKDHSETHATPFGINEDRPRAISSQRQSRKKLRQNAQLPETMKLNLNEMQKQDQAIMEEEGTNQSQGGIVLVEQLLSQKRSNIPISYFSKRTSRNQNEYTHMAESLAVRPQSLYQPDTDRSRQSKEISNMVFPQTQESFHKPRTNPSSAFQTVSRPDPLPSARSQQICLQYRAKHQKQIQDEVSKRSVSIMQNFQHRVTDILKMPAKKGDALNISLQETSTEQKCAHLSVPSFRIDIFKSASSIEEPVREYNMYRTIDNTMESTGGIVRPILFRDEGRNRVQIQGKQMNTHEYMRSVNISPIRPIAQPNEFNIRTNWTTNDIDAPVQLKQLAMQNYRIETRQNFLHNDKQFMITSSMVVDVFGIDYEKQRYFFRVHSICHPRSEKSKTVLKKKLTMLNHVLEKHLRSLIESMNKSGLPLFTDSNERMRQHFPTMEYKMSKFMSDQIQKGLQTELQKFEGCCTSIVVIEKEIVDQKTHKTMNSVQRCVIGTVQAPNQSKLEWYYIRKYQQRIVSSDQLNLLISSGSTVGQSVGKCMPKLNQLNFCEHNISGPMTDAIVFIMAP